MSYSLLPPPPRGSSRLISKRRASRRKVKILGALVTALFLFFIVSMLGLVVAFGFFARNLPSPDKLTDRNVQQATKIFDRHGNLLYNVYGDQNRTLVTLDKIPDNLKHATISIEDKNFYKNSGFDALGIVRALRDLLIHHRVTGASTITQQVVKNTLLTSERTITRKIKEFILAVQIDRRYTKDEILQIYLNEIPYGGTAWGVEAASQQYFGKNVSDLDLAESATLAGLPQSPSIYSPFGSDPKAYISRAKSVLHAMRENNYIKADEEKKALDELPTLKFVQFGQDIKAPHFSLFIKKLLEEKYGEQMVLQGGLQVTTSLDLDVQNMTQKIVHDTVEAQKNLRVGNGAAIVEDTKTGQILALVGSKDYFATDIPGNYDVSTQGLRQPGSSLKPFNYLTGFKKGYTPATMYIDEKTEFGNYSPGNYDGKFHGPLSTRISLASSYNIPAVKQLAVDGVGDMLKTLQDFGITTLNDPSKYGLSLTLGGGAVHLYEETNAYAMLGNMGKYVQASPILKVADSKGNVLEEYKPAEVRQVATPEHVYMIDNVLADKTAKYPGYGSYWADRLNFQPNIAVKTGTSDNKVDNWSFGTTPGYTVGVWVGNNDNSPMHPSLSSGVTGAAPIYHDVMVQLLKINPQKYNVNEAFVRPAGVVEAKVDALSGMKPGPFTTQTRTDVFAKWQVPTQEDDMHVKVRVCKTSGLIASPACEASGQAEDRMFTVLYDPYTKLFNPSYKKCDPCPPTQTDTSFVADQNPTVQITSPADNSHTLSTTFTVTALANAPDGSSIKRVDFFLDDTSNKKGSDSTASGGNTYSFSYSGVSVGVHTLIVRAIADNGTQTDSAPIKVTVP